MLLYTIAEDLRFVVACCAGNDDGPVLVLDYQGAEINAFWPAAYAYHAEHITGSHQVFSVMAVDIDGERSHWGGGLASNYEDPSAPGSVTISAPGGGTSGNSLSTSSIPSWERFNGTSAATPHVTGLVASLQEYLSNQMGWTAGQIKQQIQLTARPAEDLMAKDIIDCDYAMNWINLTEPSFNPDPELGLSPPVIAGPVEFVTHFNLSEGVMSSYSVNTRIDYYVSSPATGFVLVASTSNLPMVKDAEWDAYEDTVIFNPAAFPQLAGEVAIQAWLFSDYQTLFSWEVPAVIIQ